MIKKLKDLATANKASENGGVASSSQGYISSLDGTDIKPPTKEEGFLINSGASHHMTFTKDNYINFYPAKMSTQLADGRSIHSDGHGDILIDCYYGNGSATNTIRLNNV